MDCNYDARLLAQTSPTQNCAVFPSKRKYLSMFLHDRKQTRGSPHSTLVHPEFESCCVSKSQSDFYYQLLTTVRMDFEYSQILANAWGPALSTFFSRGACEWDWSTCQYSLPPHDASENKRSPERRIGLRNSMIVTVAMLLSQLPITPASIDLVVWLIDWLIWIDIIHVEVRWVSTL